VSEPGDDVVAKPAARLDIFGFQPTPADVRVIPRARSWRTSRALGSLALCWCIMPIVGLIPPHIPWVLGAFIAGIYLAHKYWTEQFTLVSMRGTCPKCGNTLAIDKVQKLKTPHPITCNRCQHQVLLYVEE
jgi:hypothetical protein